MPWLVLYLNSTSDPYFGRMLILELIMNVSGNRFYFERQLYFEVMTVIMVVVPMVQYVDRRLRIIKLYGAMSFGLLD